MGCFDDWKFGFQLVILYICSFFSVKQPLFLKEVYLQWRRWWKSSNKNTGDK